ncbi:MAG: MCE family protein, partial [Candidatus Dadabacteria bacterium]|nr:MCE family protein [Candidatus Dadabacteria bacterium]
LSMNNNTKAGLFFLLGFLLLLFVFEFVSDLPFIENKKEFKTFFKSVDELNVGNPVKFSGVEVGKITKIRIDKDKIEVLLKVDKDVPVKTDSKATIRLTSLLGTSYLNLSFGSAESELALEGATLESEEPTDINEILSNVQDTISSISSTFETFDVFGENKEEVSALIKNLNTVVKNLSEGKGTLGKLITDDKLYDDATGTFANVREITSSIKSGKGTLGKLLTDESLYNETKTAMTNLGEFTKNISLEGGTLGKLLNDDTLYNEATEAATNLNAILKKINDGQGTLGLLVNDDSLYLDAKDTLQKVDKGVDTVEDLAPLGIVGTVFGVVRFF